MKGRMLVCRIAVCLAAVGMCFPQLAFAAGPQGHQAALIGDVQLHKGGVLVGQVVNAENVAMAETEVSIHSGQKTLASASTDENGYFAFAGLSSGLYEMAAAKGHGVYRAWEHGTAPPVAQPAVLIVSGNQTVRGGLGDGKIMGCLLNPIVLAGIIATAITVPLAIHNTRKPSSP